MIAVPYQDGMVVGMLEAEKQVVWSYLRYSRYMFGRLAGPGDRTVPPYVNNILHIIDANLRMNLSRRVGVRYVRISRQLAVDNVSNLGFYVGDRVFPGINFHIALSPRIIQTFRTWQFDFARAEVALQRRLKGETFPNPIPWLTFMAALRGTPVNTFEGYSELFTSYSSQHWNGVFPKVFPTLISLEKWGVDAGEILQCFARARGVSVGTVGKLVRVKI